MRAILTDQPMICTPRIVYMVNFMKRWKVPLLLNPLSVCGNGGWSLRCLSAASCPSTPSCACIGSWVQISACTPSWLRERRPWTTTRRRTGSRGSRPTRTEAHKTRKHEERNHCGWFVELRMRRERDWVETGALALSRCKGFSYCSSGTKKAVYYTKDLFDFFFFFFV